MTDTTSTLDMTGAYKPSADELRIIEWLKDDIGKTGYVPGICSSIMRGEHRIEETK